jgi:3-hydroxyacyl-CoA dehydrogenase
LPAVVAAIEACPKPIVAAIQGAALGSGYEIALACDGRVAVENAVVGLPEGTFGISLPTRNAFSKKENAWINRGWEI